MKKMNFLIAALVALSSVTTWAGAEHDHGAPTFQAPKGGVLKSTHSTHFELVKGENSVSIYAYSQDGKSIATSGLKLSADLELPRKKAAPLVLNDKSTHWEAAIDAQGAHRFTVKVTIDDGKEKDYVKFTIEK